LRISSVCKKCNSDLSRLVDDPFSKCFYVQLARYAHDIGGKRGNVPFPFGATGTFPDGKKVSLNRDFKPHVKRSLTINKTADGQLEVDFSIDATDREKVEQMLGGPLRKAMSEHFPDWPVEKVDTEISRILEHARNVPSAPNHSAVRLRYHFNADDLLFEFLKIAYEGWFRTFGYPWIHTSSTAALMRRAIMNRETAPIHGQLFVPEIPLLGDGARHHHLVQMRGVCQMRIFNFTCGIECEAAHPDYQLAEEDSLFVLLDFVGETFEEGALIDYLAKRMR
jgi:hypothetical protein